RQCDELRSQVIGASDDPPFLAEHVAVRIERDRRLRKRYEDERAARRELLQGFGDDIGSAGEIESDVEFIANLDRPVACEFFRHDVDGNYDARSKRQADLQGGDPQSAEPEAHDYL